jgi:DNA-binding transcriptional LysR family regulator
MHITLRQFRVFEAVARHQSFTLAAKELHLSQPAVSMQVKQMEDQVGLPLYEQVGKRIHLTQAGQEIFHYSRAIGQLLTEAEEVIEELKGSARGRLTISVTSTAKYFVPALLGIFHERFPGITVSLDVTNRETVVKQLSQNSVDLVVMGQPPKDMELESGIFMDNPLVIIAPPSHPLAGEKRIPLKRLEDEVFLTREPGSGTRSAIERFFNQQGVRLRTGMEIASNEAIKQSVQAGLGLGLLSRDTLDMELSLGKLVILDVVDFPILRHWYVMHRKGKRLSAAAQAFKQFLLDEANGLVHGGGAGKT